MKQKSIGAFFGGAGAKAGAKQEASAKPAKEESKPETKPKPVDPASDQENDADAASRPARKRLRRAVIEDDDDAAPAVASKPAAGAVASAPKQPAAAEPELEDTDAAMTDAAAARAEDAAAPAAAPAAAAGTPTKAATASEETKAAGAGTGTASKPAAPIASIFQRPAVRKAAAAAAAAGGSPAPGSAKKTGGAAGASASPAKASASPAKAGRGTNPAGAATSTKDTSAPAATAAAAGGEEGKAAAASPAAKKPKTKARAPKAEKAAKEGEDGEAGDEAEEEASEEDPISDSDDDAGGEVNDLLPDGDAGGGGSGGGKKAKAKKAAGSSKSGKGAQMEGVGTGALAAAAKYKGQDISAAITWKEGQPVLYSLLANTFEAIAGTTKRLEIVALLVSAFRAILATNPPDLLPAVYLCVNRVAPAHAGIELGIGEATLIKAMCEATGKNEASIKKSYEEHGDLGVVAVGARSTQRTMFAPPPLTIASVLKAFQNIAQVTGTKSGDQKRGMIVKLLVAAKGNEPGYVVRSLQAKLRIGLAEQSVLVALSHAVHLHRGGPAALKQPDVKLAEALEAGAQVVKQAYSECPSYDVLVPALVEHGSADLLSRCHFMPGVPVKPMLAKATNGVGEVLEKFTDIEFTVEYKYDGERAQVHVLDGGKSVHIFSRNAENNTPKYPDIVSRIKGLLKPEVDSIVFDAEAVAYDPEKKKILPFQVLSTRARKDVSVGDIKVQVVLFAFDCLYLNGESLLHKPLTERRAALYGSLSEKEGELLYASYKTSRDVEELESFLNESVEAGTEGLIVKTLGDTYEPSKRSSHWLKLKKDYMEGVGDTFDVVPVGAFFGKGKRTGVFGAYLLAVYDPDTETYQTISKLGTGFSEEQLSELAETMRPHTIPQPRHYYTWDEGLVPDVWFDAAVVWEVKAADLSISPRHKAALGLVDPTKGISIRFPRLIRVRDDKSPEDATTAAQVADMFRSQAVIRQQKAQDNQAGEEGEDE
ncbi:hypothetical protein HXX76_003761 [Chlamydomonas incerta]|uniref:DNA ligase n=1 Tax=Chlamydomonas incerta TaxID=51695 RepID=A0A835W821_CHLIN|nr:hypothetical protein HXX76_003761 [Chlamydomonas incerta]|eukprot:KAG2440908.1 hypothetical protein HXX76_003761 [Chlamydomonas incerta]